MRWRPGLRGLNTVAAAVGASLLVMATGCGGGGVGDPTTATTARPGDQALAERMNLQLSDLPPEWKSAPVPRETLDAAEADAAAVADCMGRPRPAEIRVASAYSLDYSASDTRRASSSVAVVKTDEIAAADFVALRSDRAAPCLKAQIDNEFRRQLPGEPPPQTSVQPIDLPVFGDGTVGYRVTAVTDSQGREVRTVIDLAYVRVGRAEVSAAFINRSASFPTELERSMLQRMAGRG